MNFVFDYTFSTVITCFTGPSIGGRFWSSLLLIGDDNPFVFPLVNVISLGIGSGIGEGGAGGKLSSLLIVVAIGSGSNSTGGKDIGSGRLSDVGSGSDGKLSVEISGNESAAFTFDSTEIVVGSSGSGLIAGARGHSSSLGGTISGSCANDGGGDDGAGAIISSRDGAEFSVTGSALVDSAKTVTGLGGFEEGKGGGISSILRTSFVVCCSSTIGASGSVSFGSSTDLTSSWIGDEAETTSAVTVGRTSDSGSCAGTSTCEVGVTSATGSALTSGTAGSSTGFAGEGVGSSSVGIPTGVSTAAAGVASTGTDAASATTGAASTGARAASTDAGATSSGAGAVFTGAGEASTGAGAASTGGAAEDVSSAGFGTASTATSGATASEVPSGFVSSVLLGSSLVGEVIFSSAFCKQKLMINKTKE